MRPRKKDRHLPACVYIRSGSYYLVKHNKWTMIGKTLHEALSNYAKTEAPARHSMALLLDRYMASLKLAKNTMASYGTARNHLAKIFEEFEPHQIKVRDINEMMFAFREKPGTANLLRKVLSGALDLAIIEGLIEHNPCRDAKPLKVKARDRYVTDAEYETLYASANPSLQVVLDLLYLTGQRIGDVLGIKYSDLTEHGIQFAQQKTGKKLIVGWNDDLRSAVRRAKELHQSVKGLANLLHGRDGRPIPYSRIQEQFERLRNRVGINDIHIHDLRAKAGTDAKSAGLDSMALLGHSTESSHKRYLRGRDIPVVKGVSIRKRG